jgi:hypothetical protein
LTPCAGSTRERWISRARASSWASRSLDAHGLPTRFVSLGNFGHGYPADMEERMREPMEWVSGG